MNPVTQNLPYDHENWSRRTRSGGQGVGSAKHNAASLDGIEALPHHGNDGARGHVLDEAREEGLALQVSIVCKIE